MRQNAGEMVQRAALVVGISGAMVVLAAAVMDVMVVGVLGDVGAGIICGVPLGSGDMLEMDGDQRHHARNLGDQKQPKKPTAETSLGGQQNHRTGSRLGPPGAGSPNICVIIGTQVVQLVAEWSRPTRKRGRPKGRHEPLDAGPGAVALAAVETVSVRRREDVIRP
jgi:hypothetical protein